MRVLKFLGEVLANLNARSLGLVLFDKGLVLELHFYQGFFLDEEALQLLFEALITFLEIVKEDLVLFLGLVVEIKVVVALVLLDLVFEVL